MSQIVAVEILPVRLPITRTFTFASGSAGAKGGTAPHVFVKVTDSEGRVGWGEGRPVPQWSYETLETVVTTLRYHLAPALIGQSIHDRWGLHRRMHMAIGRGPSTGQPIAKAALDIAVHDLCAQAAGVTLREFLGGSRERREMALSYTLTAHTVDDIAHDIAAGQALGFKHFNFKAAVDPQTDGDVALAIRKRVDKDAFVWADAHQGYRLHEARQVAALFSEAGVNILEQPLLADQKHQMRSLRQSTHLALAVDESSVSPADFFAYAAEGLVDYLVIKITRSGGLWPSLQQIAVAESAGLPLLVSGLTDGFITKIAACQLALAFGFVGPAALNGSQFMDESALFPDKTQIEKGGVVCLNDRTGLGVAPDEDALKHYLAKELLT